MQLQEFHFLSVCDNSAYDEIKVTLPHANFAVQFFALLSWFYKSTMQWLYQLY